MSARLESLHPRLHFAATPDPSFGDHGVATVGPTGASTQYTLGVNHSVYAYQAGGKQLFYVVRLADDGTPDAAFGTGGRADIPFNVVQKMAYDARRDQLIVIGYKGTRYRDHTTALQVLKLNADGTRAAEFGTDGHAEFVPTAPAGRNDGAWVDAESVNVLPHGGLLVGMKVSGFDNQSDGQPYAQSIDSTLLRLNDNGKKTLGFGHRGTRTLASGASSYTVAAGGQAAGFHQVDDIPSLTDVRPLADGGFKFALTRSDRDETQDASTYTATTDVLTRTVGAAGAIDVSADATWRIYDAAAAGAGAGDHFAAGAFATDAGATALGIGPATGALAFTLSPGKAVRPQRVTLPAGSPRIIRYDTFVASRAGYTVFGQSRTGGRLVGVALELTPQFESDTAWGDSVVLTIDRTLNGVSPNLDDHGRVLAFGDVRIVRYIVR